MGPRARRTPPAAAFLLLSSLALLAAPLGCAGEISTHDSPDLGATDGWTLADTQAVDGAPLKDPETGSSDAHHGKAVSPAGGLRCLTPADVIVIDARSHLGQSYVYGAEGPCKKGYDCSGLVYAVFKETGYFSIIGSGSARTVGAIAAVFSKKGLEDTDTSKLPKLGDLVTFGSYAHIGIYSGQKNAKGTYNAKGWVVNALNETSGVVENKVDAISPAVHSYLHTGLSVLPCSVTAWKPPACT
jgi:cell wall-associated NlpC family hydrolase